MISRVAESCFWLTRYLVRVAATAHMLAVNRVYLLDHDKVPLPARWLPLVAALGEEEHFLKAYQELSAAEEEECVQAYFTMDRENLSSIYNMLQHARENAKNVREVLSLEMWESLNALWLWLNNEQSQHLFQWRRDKFYKHLMDQCQLFYGLLQTTIRHDEPFIFLQLGYYLEQAAQTARTLDMNYHVTVLLKKAEFESYVEPRWHMLLQCCSANMAFIKSCGEVPDSETIALFLIYDDFFPSSIVFCVSQALHLVEQMQSTYTCARGRDTALRLAMTLTELLERRQQISSQSGQHQLVNELIENVYAVAKSLQDEFFAPQSHQHLETIGIIDQT